MPRPCPRDWRTLRVDGFLRRRPLVREQKGAPRLRTKGPSPERRSRAFALRRPAPQERQFDLRQLCVKSAEVFLIFALVPCTSGTTLNGLRFAFGSVAPHHPVTLSPPCAGVTAANNYIGH